MTLIAEQARAWKPARWQAFCRDAVKLVIDTPCLLCGPQLGGTVIDPRPGQAAAGLHVDHWTLPGQPVTLWPLDPTPYRVQIACTPLVDPVYTRFALMLLLRALHHAGDRTLSLQVTPDLSSEVLNAGQQLGRLFADQRDCDVREMAAGA